MKKLLFILISIALTACSKSNEVEESYFLLDAAVEFSIFNSENEDLLNPENKNHINTSKIKLFYIINGEKQEFYNGNYSSPRNYLIYKHENEYRIRVFLNNTETTDKTVTYIQWNESDTDTLEMTYTKTNNSFLQDVIWLNGKQIWKRIDNVDPYFKLTK